VKWLKGEKWNIFSPKIVFYQSSPAYMEYKWKVQLNNQPRMSTLLMAKLDREINLIYLHYIEGSSSYFD